VIVPSWPGLTSALGLLTSDISYDFSQTLMQSLARPDVGRLRATFEALEARARDQLLRDGLAAEALVFLRFADCRYVGQGYELRANAPSGAIDEGFVAQLADSFHAAHRRRYGSHFPDKAVQLVNARVIGVGKMQELRPAEIAPGGGARPTSQRQVVFEDATKPREFATPIFDRARLGAGDEFAGPAIVEQMDTTTVVPPGFTARVDRFGNLVIATR
jgi:N-methylhydantoinase A/oxoprolinase/acetone carboxylase beta subunit